jgi:hypothetical protein
MDRPKISLEDLEELICTCGNNRFEQKITMRRISALLTGGEARIEPISLIVCDKCGKTFEAPKLVT